MNDYTVTEAQVENGGIEYTAENGEGEQIRGRLTRRSAGPGTVITDQGLQQMAEQMVGMEVDTGDVDLQRGELDEFSIAGDFGE